MTTSSTTQEKSSASPTGDPQTPLVSIVTPSFNQAHFIEKTILSVVLQDYVNIEYIVMDALSSDGTDKILAKYAADGLMVSEKDEGQSDAINKGFSRSSGEIMAYLNSDDCFYSPTVISRVVQLFAENPGVDVIVGKREYIDEAGYYVMNYPFRKWDSKRLLESCYIPQEATFWRRSIFEKAGNCVDKSFRFAMDYDLWLRFIAAGANFMSVDEYYGLFRWYPGQKSTDIWQKHGVPEIARLQQKHLGHAMPEDEMIAVYQEYWYGSNRLHNREVYKHSVPTWQTFTSYKKQLLNSCTRDSWVFVDHLTKPDRSAIVAKIAERKPNSSTPSPTTSNTAPQSLSSVPEQAAETLDLVLKYNLFDKSYYEKQVGNHLDDPFDHYHTKGFLLGLNPHPMFDVNFYLQTYPDVQESGLDPLEHWLRTGAEEGRNPHPIIDCAYLQEQDKDAQSNLDAFARYQTSGWLSTRSPSRLFNQEFYIHQLKQNGKPKSNESALEHYLRKGYRDGINPHPLFSVRFYQAQLETANSIAVEPLSHYIRFGSIEGRNPHPLFDAGYFAKTVQVSEQRSTLEQFLDYQGNTSCHPAFSVEYYAKQAALAFPNAAQAICHYLTVGWRNGLNPHPLFDTTFYLQKLETDGLATQEPLGHYLRNGYREQRNPHPLFDSKYYLEQRPALASGYMSPLVHYLTRGLNYKTNPNRLFDTALYESCEPANIYDPQKPALERYLSCAWEHNVDPNEKFDTAYYLTQNQDIETLRVNPLLHYVQNYELANSPASPFFDPHFHSAKWEAFVESCKGRVIWKFIDAGNENDLTAVADAFLGITLVSVRPTEEEFRGGKKKYKGLRFINENDKTGPDLVLHPIQQISLANELWKRTNVEQIIVNNFFGADQSLQIFLKALGKPFDVFIGRGSHPLLPGADGQEIGEILCRYLDENALEVGANFKPRSQFNWWISRSWLMQHARKFVVQTNELKEFVQQSGGLLGPAIEMGTLNELIGTPTKTWQNSQSERSDQQRSTINIGLVCKAGPGWIGGTQYLNNLLKAASIASDGLEVQCTLLKRKGEDIGSRLTELHGWQNIKELTDWTAFNELSNAELDCILTAGELFQHPTIPVITWLYDLQHKELPALFPPVDIAARDSLFEEAARSSSRIIVSSEHAKNVFSMHYPQASDKVSVLRFKPRVTEIEIEQESRYIRPKYKLPEQFFYLPNQFWLHKNHRTVISALSSLREQGQCPTVVCTGSIHDQREPSYFISLLNEIATHGLGGHLLILGIVPREDVIALFKECAAVIQPSLYEGWSTSVEEAKIFDKSIVLSDIQIHREQAAEHALYFPSTNSFALTDRLKEIEAKNPRRLEKPDYVRACNEFEKFGSLAASIFKSTVFNSQT